MFQKDPHVIARLISDDVKTIEKRARFIVYVDNEGNPYHMVERKGYYYLDVFSVIGAGTFRNVYYSKVVLLEIGFGRARPYHAASMPKELVDLSGKKSIPQRRNIFFLNAAQMSNLWPTIETVLTKKAYEQINLWKKGNKWTLYMPKRQMKHRSKGYTVRGKWTDVERGIHYSVSKKDSELLRIIYASDISYNSLSLEGYARYVCVCLKKYRMHSYSDKQLAWYASHPHSGMRALVDSVTDQKILAHRASYMMRCMDARKANLLIMILNAFNLLEEMEVIEANDYINSSIFFQEETKIRVIPKRRKNQDYVVFELVPEME